MVVRVQAQDESWLWLYMVLQLQPGEIPISSNNYIIRYLLLLSKTKPGFMERNIMLWLFFSFLPKASLRPGLCVSS